jgi:hypothetical protein
MANRNQPSSGSFEYTNEWANGMLNCCEDFKTFICAVYCLPCALCDLNKEAGVKFALFLLIFIFDKHKSFFFHF